MYGLDQLNILIGVIKHHGFGVSRVSRASNGTPNIIHNNAIRELEREIVIA